MSSAHPLLRLLLAHPELLVEHVSAYAELAADDGRALLRRWQRQWRWRLLAYVALAIGVLLAGQALMLWVLFRPAPGPGLTLLLLPLLPLGVGVLALQAAAALLPRDAQAQAFAAVQRQLAVDRGLLRSASS